ncbi:hypothetical protein N3K66_003896 [Trichothecium roseum]|uniref:Uncharacterized protein n=1 Tax=Trichothecium roseum TaxID=47278 RepID=A0ACC0V6T8_9HYPO|nr:hypothetical protein N3K66_003896 [Trichothecium roseum]
MESSESRHQRLASIESWRHGVPSHTERGDPFDDDADTRPSTRLTIRTEPKPEPEPELGPGLQRRPSTRLSLFRRNTTASAAGRRSGVFGRAGTALGLRSETAEDKGFKPGREGEGAKGPKEKKTNKGSQLIGRLFSRKRRRSPSPEPEPGDGPGIEPEPEFGSGFGSGLQAGVGVGAESPLRLNYLFVGSRGSGQTSLLFRARYGAFPDSRAIAPTMYESYNVDLCVGSRPVAAEMWDTSGARELGKVEMLGYMRWDAVFLCFDVMDKVQMLSIISWWKRAVANGFAASQETPPLAQLVGMKMDIRENGADHNATGLALWPSNSFPTIWVCPEDACLQAEQSGFDRYAECSAWTGEGMEELIEGTAREFIARAERRASAASVHYGQEMPPAKKRRL